MSTGVDSDPAVLAWRAMRSLVLDHDRRSAVADAVGLSFIRVKALLQLADGARTMSELAAALSCDAPYATVVVDDLQRRELVSRSAHPQDRRVKVVTITAAGAEVATRARLLLEEPPAELRRLPAGDAELLAGLLTRLAH